MSLPAPIEHQGAPAALKGGKAGRISPAMRRAIDALVTGQCKTQKDAAALAGLAPEHLCRMLQKPQVQVFYAQRTRETIGRAQMRAAARLVELVDDDSGHVSLDASKHVLGIAGIKPPEDGRGVNVQVGVSVGYVIKLRHVDDGAVAPSAPEFRTEITQQDQGS
jgi:hypothetical protein